MKHILGAQETNIKLVNTNRLIKSVHSDKCLEVIIDIVNTNKPEKEYTIIWNLILAIVKRKLKNKFFISENSEEK